MIDEIEEGNRQWLHTDALVRVINDIIVWLGLRKREEEVFQPWKILILVSVS